MVGLICCKKESTQQKKAIAAIKNSFFIDGSIVNFNPRKIYLNKIIENSSYIIDSCKIENNKFSFKGSVEHPERFALSFEEYSSKAILIIENATITININGHSIDSPIIKGSELNDKMLSYQLKSKNIFKKIEYLFPQFQKYRLENNAEKLSEINIAMKKIEQEFIDFSYNFIQENSDSYISAIILRDQLKTKPIDTFKIINSFKNISDKVKLSPDSEIIKHQLELH
ncbi:DUF4369 domain-containing protein [Lutibacter citreus]|uniref:DUF4369 domain-containing protein n=1 Tax=Lutibacter citreus TaxID=2138210 RepID=UPI0013004FA1|nr:DUF4369 domain-containing protein [Lutibacter citreus]